MKATWFGWGTFRIDADVTVVVDPCVTALIDDPHASVDDCRADVMLLTHGHHEHLRDAHVVARAHDGPIVAPPQVAEYLARRRQLHSPRVRTIDPEGRLDLDGVQVLARSFPHLGKNNPAGKLAILRRNGALGPVLRSLPRVVSSWMAIRGQPEQGPYLAYDLRFHEGGRVFLTCEAFTELLDPAVAEAWGAGDRPIDLALVGVESGQEEAASELVRRLGARDAVGCAVHAPFERFYGRPPVSPARFDWPMLQPGDSVTATA